MPIPSKYLADFEENGIYHIYNRTNNKELLFLNDENKLFFLKQYLKFISPFADTFCWNLLPNHFHFVVKIKDAESIKATLQKKLPITATEKKYLHEKITFSQLIEHCFTKFFQSYAIAFNNMHKRSGNLFYKPFKRIAINKSSQFTMAVIYVHANAIKHNLAKSFDEWKWSSWHTILSSKPTLLLRRELIEWFGTLDNLIKVHNEMAAHYYNCEIAIED